METRILGGDLNAKHPQWNSKTTNTKGMKLQKHSDRDHYQVIGPDKPTHFGAIGAQTY